MTIPTRHAVVTGATQGIGLEAAKALLHMGWQVTLVGRNSSALATVSANLKQPDRVTTRVADLSLLRQTSKLGDDLLQAAQPIHALINNAGAYFNPRQLTTEGVEATWALNHLSPFGLTQTVEPLLRAAATPDNPARVVVVSSNAHTMAKKPPRDDLEFAIGYNAGLCPQQTGKHLVCPRASQPLGPDRQPSHHHQCRSSRYSRHPLLSRQRLLWLVLAYPARPRCHFARSRGPGVAPPRD